MEFHMVCNSPEHWLPRMSKFHVCNQRDNSFLPVSFPKVQSVLLTVRSQCQSPGYSQGLNKNHKHRPKIAGSHRFSK
jgi:hypothetical protein